MISSRQPDPQDPPEPRAGIAPGSRAAGQKWADVSEGHYGVSLLNDCKYGHSCKDGCLALTLVKSGIEPNPITDQEVHHFTYALFRTAKAGSRRARCGRPTSSTSRCWRWQGGTAGEAVGLASVDAPNVVLETVKLAEDGDGVILRLYESENARTPVTLTWNRPFHSAVACNCLEEETDTGRNRRQQHPLCHQTLRDQDDPRAVVITD